MKKEDLIYGNVVETRNGNKYIYNFCEQDLLSLSGTGYMLLIKYNDDLTMIDRDYISENYDIMKVYEDYTCEKVLWERKEITLTEDEKVILRNISKEYKYIARDEDGKLGVYERKPNKLRFFSTSGWECLTGFSCERRLHAFDHLFQFIKWEDEEPYLIENLLKEEN